VAVAGNDRAGLRLHLGCGSFVAPGWENVDKSWGVVLRRVPGARRTLALLGILTEEQATAQFPEGIVRADVRRGLPYEDGSATAVYTSHMIEHLSRPQALRLLRECRRVLRPGGVLRVATPDLRELVNEYLADDEAAGPTPADSFMKQLETFREPEAGLAQRLISRFVTAPHQWLYDERSLIHLIEESGFVDATRRAHLDSAIEDIDTIERRPGSLVVEARRPS
jgi:predicted SAM-dependent methyltransferase